jgi:hypothetical protein
MRSLKGLSKNLKVEPTIIVDGIRDVAIVWRQMRIK